MGCQISQSSNLGLNIPIPEVLETYCGRRSLIDEDAAASTSGCLLERFGAGGEAVEMEVDVCAVSMIDLLVFTSTNRRPGRRTVANYAEGLATEEQRIANASKSVKKENKEMPSLPFHTDELQVTAEIPCV